MKRKFFTTVALVCCFMVCLAVVADLTGKWTGIIKIPDGTEIPVTYNFKADGDKLTGTAESPQGQGSIDEGKIKGDSINFKVTIAGETYPHKGKMYADSCGLDIEAQGGVLHVTVKRADK
jgi:hypothetical protein